jgi:outer membrane protein assembly factor BamA
LGRASVTLTQPYVWSPRMSLGVGPAAEFRDNFVDRSHAWSGQATLVYRLNALQSIAFRYEYTYRKVDQTRALEFDYGKTIADVATALEAPTTSSLFTASGTFGGFDDLSRPRHGLVLKPNLSATAPPSAGNIEFARADLEATAFLPFLGKTNGFMLRGTTGGLWPYGHSIPDPASGPAVELLRLRDQLLMAGGSSDVRGLRQSPAGSQGPGDREP